MLITKEKLEELGACVESVKFFGVHYKEIDVVDLLRDVLQYKEEVERYGANVYQWSYWLIARNVSRKAGVRFAVYAAEKVLYIFEERYPLDDRPRKAIEAAKAYLENPSDKNARAVEAAAANAAYAAYAAAHAARSTYAAYAAAHAARSTYAAYAAAYAAAHAANAAARAVDAAANAAYADLSIKDQILEFGIKLIQEEEK